MSETTGAWEGEDYSLTPEQNRVITERWKRAEAAREGMDAMMKGIQQETAQSHGSKLEGLEYSLKDVDSFRRKAASAAEDKGFPVEKTAQSIHDLNRYTLTFEPGAYTEGVDRTYERLREAGYEPISEKNTWEDPVYKGVNTSWQHTQSEEKFELQFHTPDSFKAKMENHELYELSRGKELENLSQGDDDLKESYRNAANLLQNERYKNVEIPPGQERIGERLIRDTLDPDVPSEDVELIRRKEAEKRAENLAKAQAKAEAKKQAEQASLGLDGPAQSTSQGLRNHLAAPAAQAPRMRPDVPSIDPVPRQSRSRGPSLT
ncbi:hypothetical protein B7P34_10805 [Streptosporangium nondiastaticum]|uniref:Uncharacterized protein n=1 Tax=Streptosporangium nondiastaticum TaxID=35764 RepID=A0A9X7JRZ8_9ACTN|nr:hypothetical protein [Streptosporangium nondiastaticum]PSJ28772.1 hypothetical protein B7P34_10805 [Streptosporangium nondiastaticum]